MQIPLVLRASVCAALVLASARSAHAQTYEAVGTRAQSMGGAFVAVADDATATWWNPAGLATGAYFSAILERDYRREPSTVSSAGPARQALTTGFSVVFPALGLSYYRLRISEIAPTSSTAPTGAGRQDQTTVTTAVNTVALSQFGISGGQSIGSHLVV